MSATASTTPTTADNPAATPTIDPLTVAHFEYRVKSVRFIQDLSLQLRFPHSTVMTAVALVHKYLRKNTAVPIKRLPYRYELAATCLWIASKVEETTCHLERFLECVIRLASKNPAFRLQPPSTDRELQKWMSVVGQLEWVVLKDCRMDVAFIDQPHAFIDDVLRRLMAEDCIAADDFDTLMQLAWCWLNDLAKCAVFIEHHAYYVAAAGVCLSGAYFYDGYSRDEKWLDEWRRVLAVPDRRMMTDACSQVLALMRVDEVRQLMEGWFETEKLKRERRELLEELEAGEVHSPPRKQTANEGDVSAMALKRSASDLTGDE